MAQKTNNYNLIKPDQMENYNVDIFNSNADIVDSALEGLQQEINNVANLSLEVTIDSEESESGTTTQNFKQNLINLINEQTESSISAAIEGADIEGQVNSAIQSADINGQVKTATDAMSETLDKLETDIENLQQTDVSEVLKEVRQLEQQIYKTYYKNLFVDIEFVVSPDLITKIPKAKQCKFTLSFKGIDTGGGTIFLHTGEEILFTDSQASSGVFTDIIFPPDAGRYIIRIAINNPTAELYNLSTSLNYIDYTIDNSKWTYYYNSNCNYCYWEVKLYSGVRAISDTNSNNPFKGKQYIKSLYIYSVNIGSLPSYTGASLTLKNLYLSNSITSLGDYCFNDATLPNKIYLPINLTTIGNNAFKTFYQDVSIDTICYLYFGYTSKLISKGTNCFGRKNQTYLYCYYIEEEGQTINPFPTKWFKNFIIDTNFSFISSSDLSLFNQNSSVETTTFAPTGCDGFFASIFSQIATNRINIKNLSSQIEEISESSPDLTFLTEGMKMLLGPSMYPYSSIIYLKYNLSSSTRAYIKKMTDSYMLGIKDLNGTLTYFIDFSQDQRIDLSGVGYLKLYSNILEYLPDCFSYLPFYEIDLSNKMFVESETGLFQNSSNLTTVILNSEEKILPNLVFYKCNKLSSIQNTENLIEIGDSALQYTAINYLKLDNIDSIGSLALANISDTLIIDFKGTEEDWNDIYKGADWNLNTHIIVHLKTINSEGEAIESEIEYPI